MNKIIKRDGRQLDFDKMKIVDAVLAAFYEVDGKTDDYALIKAGNIADYIADIAEEKILTVEEIQDIVEKGLMSTKRKDVAKAFILYRENRSNFRNVKENLTKKYKQLNELISGEDEESKKENSNKDTRIIPTMRDYIAGFTCRELADTLLLPQDVQKANKIGEINFHNSNYNQAMQMNN